MTRRYDRRGGAGTLGQDPGNPGVWTSGTRIGMREIELESESRERNRERREIAGNLTNPWSRVG